MTAPGQVRLVMGRAGYREDAGGAAVAGSTEGRRRPGRRADVAGDGRPDGAGGPGGPEEPGGEAGPEPTRGDKRRYFVLMGICIALFVSSWAVVDRYSVLAAVILSAVALVIPPFAAIVANVASATDRRRR
jgi:Protein of unknown function (DUF3099)